ncbi:MAG: DUF4394 domain-containing protein, partial [Chthoniobacterales bacterium]|nr:DUF4394 domain-containing protein [Chthoniobacterales bacterium]
MKTFSSRRVSKFMETLESRRLMASAIALTTDGRLRGFDTDTPGTYTSNVTVTGLQSGESLIGIDYRPATGQLFGLGDSGRIYRVKATSGAATSLGASEFAVDL